MSLLYFPSSSSSGGGALTFISNATASSDSSLEFTSGIDSTYESYYFYFDGLKMGTDDVSFSFQSSTNGGTAYGISCSSATWYAYNSGSANDLAYLGSQDLFSSSSEQPCGFYLGNDADIYLSGWLSLAKPASTSLIKNWSYQTFYHNKNNEAVMLSGQGFFDTSTAIDAIRFQPSSGNFDGTISLYGLKQS